MDKRTLLFVLLTTAAFFAVNIFFGIGRDREARDTLIEPPTVVEEPAVAEAAPVTVNEKFYVLENGYQQLVFSNVGGALAEINLPFEDQGDEESAVKEIGFDRTMEERYPENAQFPAFRYYVPGETATSKPKIGGYYPLLRRPLIDAQGQPVSRVPPQFYALNVVGKHPEVANLEYEVVEFTKSRIVFESRESGRTIRKTFTLPTDAKSSPYVLDVEVAVDGDRAATQGLWITSGVPEVEILGRSATNILKYRQTRRGKSEVEKISAPKPGKMVSVGSVRPDWLVNSNSFFGVIVDPLTEIGAGYRAEYVPGTEVPTRLVMIDHEHERYKASRYNGYNTLMPLTTNGGVMKFRVFAGPFATHILKTVDATYTNPQTGENPDYIGSQSFLGYFSFISRPFSKMLLVVMNFFFWITRSWVASIILLTVVLRLVLYPLSAWSMKSMRRMQKIQPEVQAIQKKHKKEPRKAQAEVMQLYRTRKVNPISGCLPIIIQMPFLIGMFDLLKSTYALRGATFIPGWIENLTAPDVLFSWGTPIFFIGTEFHLLPLVLGGVMLLQQRFTAAKLPKDKTLWTDQQRQQRLMSNVMVVAFAAMFYNFPAGLNIYWLSSMLLSILQQWIINRQLDRKPDLPAKPPKRRKAKVTG